MKESAAKSTTDPIYLSLPQNMHAIILRFLVHLTTKLSDKMKKVLDLKNISAAKAGSSIR